MSDAIGWAGSIFFAISAAPQAWKSYKDGNSDGLAWWFLLLWLAGEICYITATLVKFGLVGWMMFNYIFGTMFLLMLIWFKLNPEKKNERICLD